MWRLGGTTGRARRADCRCRRHVDWQNDGGWKLLSNHADAEPDRYRCHRRDEHQRATRSVGPRPGHSPGRGAEAVAGHGSPFRRRNVGPARQHDDQQRLRPALHAASLEVGERSWKSLDPRRRIQAKLTHHFFAEVERSWTWRRDRLQCSGSVWCPSSRWLPWRLRRVIRAGRSPTSSSSSSRGALRTGVAIIVGMVRLYAGHSSPEQERNMRKSMRAPVALLALVLAFTAMLGPEGAIAVEPSMIDRETESALKVLYETTPEAKQLAANAKGILVFPNIVRAGFIFGAQYGDGELIKAGQ